MPRKGQPAPEAPKSKRKFLKDHEEAQNSNSNGSTGDGTQSGTLKVGRGRKKKGEQGELGVHAMSKQWTRTEVTVTIFTYKSDQFNLVLRAPEEISETKPRQERKVKWLFFRSHQRV